MGISGVWEWGVVIAHCNCLLTSFVSNGDWWMFNMTRTRRLGLGRPCVVFTCVGAYLITSTNHMSAFYPPHPFFIESL